MLKLIKHLILHHEITSEGYLVLNQNTYIIWGERGTKKLLLQVTRNREYLLDI